MPLVKPVREPDAGNPQVRFDERRRETEPRPRLRHRHQAKAAGNSDSLDLQPPRPPPTLPSQGQHGADGKFSAVGNYLFRNHVAMDFDGGLWGILRGE